MGRDTISHADDYLELLMGLRACTVAEDGFQLDWQVDRGLIWGA